MNIYEKIKRRKGYISALAPMEGVTDSVFRQVLCDIGRPDLFFTEFLSVEGFCSKGRERVAHRLEYVRKEKPVVFQLWGNVPEYYAESVRKIRKLKPAGIDINIGCSVHDVLSSGKGSALIKEKGLVGEIVDAVRSESGNLPVSVKTRLGYDSVDVEGWIGFLLEKDLDLITVHGRVSKQGYGDPASWEDIGRCVKLRNSMGSPTLILGNGDIKSYGDGVQRVADYGLDGFMVGRGILSDPWFFSKSKVISPEERINVLLKHFRLFEKFWNGSKPFNSQKKYIKAYISDFDGANDFRKELMFCNSVEEVEDLCRDYDKMNS